MIALLEDAISLFCDPFNNTVFDFFKGIQNLENLKKLIKDEEKALQETLIKSVEALRKTNREFISRETGAEIST